MRVAYQPKSAGQREAASDATTISTQRDAKVFAKDADVKNCLELWSCNPFAVSFVSFAKTFASLCVKIDPFASLIYRFSRNFLLAKPIVSA